MKPRPNPQEHQAQIDQAIKQFRAWRQSGVSLLDVETTSLEGWVWQFALVDSQALTPRLAFNSTPLVPREEWSDKAREMMEAQKTHLYKSPVSEAFQGVVISALLNFPAVAWNADFDLAAIERTWPTATDGVAVACAMRAYAPIYGQWSESKQDWKYASLDAALEREGVDVIRLPTAHSAYGDCVRLAALIEAVASRETSSEQAERQTAEDVALYGDGSSGPE